MSDLIWFFLLVFLALFVGYIIGRMHELYLQRKIKKGEGVVKKMKDKRY